MINSEKDLLEYVKSCLPLDAIVVEGYDGVGKGKVLGLLSKDLGITPYRPDYNLWQKYDHRQIDRWKVSGFFWDVYSHFLKVIRTPMIPMLFDRGVISGAVYNHDRKIAEDYKEILRGSRVLHILVYCSYTDFVRFQEIRNSASEDIESEWCKYLEYTNEYHDCLEISGVDYVTYHNRIIESEVSKLEETCEGCGHYSFGVCRHPEINSKVDPSNPRCNLSSDKEVQDIYDNEMQCV